MRSTSITAIFAMAVSVAAPLEAQNYPWNTVDVIIPSSPGSGVDILGRGFLDEMSKALGATLVPLNRPGAANTLGAALVAAAAADGRTLGFTSAGPFVSQPHLQELVYAPVDFTFICQAFEVPVVYAVREDSPYDSLEDVVQAAKNGEKITVSSAGVATIPHVVLSELSRQTGAEFLHAPYSGDAAALQAMLSGEVVIGGLGYGTIVGQPVKILSVFSEERVPAIPNVTTAVEAGYNIVNSGSAGLFAPAGLPDDVRSALESACRDVVNSEVFGTLAANLNQTPRFMDTAAWTERLTNEFETNKALMQQNGN